MIFLKKVWAWVGANSAHLQALGATVGVLVLIFGVPRFGRSADLAIVVRTHSSTLSAELVDWFDDVSRNVVALPPPRKDNDPMCHWLEGFEIDQLRKLRDNHPWKVGASVATGLDQCEVTIRNRSDREIANVRVRVDGLYHPWGTRLKAELSTATEVGEWEAKADAATSGTKRDGVVLPNLPPVPPGGEVSIVLNGSTLGTPPTVKVTGASTETLAEATVVDAWPAAMIIHPDRWSFFLWWCGLSTVLIVWAWVSNVRRKAQERIAHVHAEDIADRLLSRGHRDAAIAVLGTALDWGSERESLSKDPRFSELDWSEPDGAKD